MQNYYKYRTFDKHIWDMLEKSELYFCPANAEDDSKECIIDFIPINEFEALDKILVQYGNYIIEKLAKLFGKEIIKDIPVNLKEYFSINVFNKEKFITDMAKIFSDIPLFKIELCADLISQLFYLDCDTNNDFEGAKTIARTLVNLRDTLGICSLATSNYNMVLWKEYADNFSGCCIEYNASNLNEKLYKVNYADFRNNDVIKILLDILFDCVVSFFKRQKMDYDFSKTVEEITCVKDEKWSYQEEYRFFGSPNSVRALMPITSVYLGKKCSQENLEKVLKIANKKGFIVYKMDFNNEFKRITQ